jgi:hypothetical protein
VKNIKKCILSGVLALGMIGNTGCAVHHTRVKSSFVKVNVSTVVDVCGIRATKESKCVRLMSVESSGSGAVVLNDRVFGGKPRTLVLTANHVCMSGAASNISKELLESVRQKENFIGSIDVITNVSMSLLDSNGQKYLVEKEPWVRNIPADICIVEASINAPALSIAGNLPKFGDRIINIAAPGGFMEPSSSGGVVYIVDGRYSGSWMVRNSGVRSMYTMWAMGGSSGSPILNKSGEMIGMVSAINTSFWPRAFGMTQRGEPVFINVYSAASPLTISPTLVQIDETIKAAISAMNRGKPFVYPKLVSLEPPSSPAGAEGSGDTGDLIYPIYISE